MPRGFQRLGGDVYTGTHVASIDEGPVIKATTARGPVVHAALIVVATNSPINDWVALHTKQAPYMTYVVGLRVPRGALDAALYWDTLDPYHYVRLQHGRANARDMDGLDLLIVGGEDHKTGQADDQEQRFTRLEEWARPRFPMAGEVAYRWSGQVMETIDGLAFIGRNPGGGDNVHVVTGDSGMGMTHGTIAGILLTDLFLGRPNPWASLYDPARKTLRAAGEFLRENLNVAQQYGDWLTGGDVAGEKEIQAGSGALIRRGLTKVAVYRDETGALHELSAVCPHLGCLVSWNDVEKIWDCPCHGSRFDARGEVVNGPANRGLEPA